MTFSTIRFRAARFFPTSVRAPAPGPDFPRHGHCSHDGAMRVLEARFHPQRRGQQDFLMVGYLVWRDQRGRERPVFESAGTAVPDPVLSKLRYLVDVTEPGSYERLQALRSEFWSFVPIDADQRQPAKYGDVI